MAFFNTDPDLYEDASMKVPALRRGNKAKKNPAPQADRPQ